MSTMDVREVKRRFRPSIGPSLSSDLVRLGVGIVILAICVLIQGIDLYLAFGVLLTIATVAFPRSPAPWALGIVLAISSLDGFQSPPGWRFFVALAGVHAIHQFGLMLSWLPGGGRIQLRVLGRLLRTYLIIQIPAQLVAFALLNLLSGASATTLISPVFGLVAAAGIVLLLVLVIAPLLRSMRPSGR